LTHQLLHAPWHRGHLAGTQALNGAFGHQLTQRKGIAPAVVVQRGHDVGREVVLWPATGAGLGHAFPIQRCQLLALQQACRLQGIQRQAGRPGQFVRARTGTPALLLAVGAKHQPFQRCGVEPLQVVRQQHRPLGFEEAGQRFEEARLGGVRVQRRQRFVGGQLGQQARQVQPVGGQAGGRLANGVAQVGAVRTQPFQQRRKWHAGQAFAAVQQGRLWPAAGQQAGLAGARFAQQHDCGRRAGAQGVLCGGAAGQGLRPGAAFRSS
jgi:hypothetical protein